MLDLLKEAGLSEIELLGLLAGHHELTGVLLVLVLLLRLAELGSIWELIEAFFHQLGNFGTEFFPFLVPTPLIYLRLT